MSPLSTAPIIAFGATTDVERAKEFYRDQLGLRLVSEDGFALVFDAAGTMLRVQRVREVGVAQYTPPGSAAKVAWFEDPDGNILSLTQY